LLSCLRLLIYLQVLATTIPASETRQITSQATVTSSESNLPPPLSTESPLKRDDWMLERTTADAAGSDFFSNMGTTKHKKPPPENRDPDKVLCFCVYRIVTDVGLSSDNY
jgi:hypothetical protein